MRYRSQALELMDEPSCSFDEFKTTLKEIESINVRLNGYAPSLEGIKKLSVKSQNVVRILDVGTGAGDTPRKIVDWARRQKLKVEVTAIDLSPHITALAKEWSAGYSTEIEYQTCNLFDLNESHSFDIVHAGMMLHHLSDEQIVPALSQMKKLARVGVVINDLHRHYLACWSIGFLTKILGYCAMVRYDAPLSVRRAFIKQELVRYFEQAQYEDFKVVWRPMFRWLVVSYTDRQDGL